MLYKVYTTYTDGRKVYERMNEKELKKMFDNTHKDSNITKLEIKFIKDKE